LAGKALLRLKTRAQFQAVLAQRVIAKSEHFALHRHSLEGSATAAGQPAMPQALSAPSAAVARPLFSPLGLWLGAMVPKRWAKRSVTRHAIKRQIYDVADAMLPTHDQAAYLVRLRTGFSRQHFLSSSSEQLKQAVRAELQGLMARVSPPA
jgi:ribonuclease P protein component